MQSKGLAECEKRLFSRVDSGIFCCRIVRYSLTPLKLKIGKSVFER